MHTSQLHLHLYAMLRRSPTDLVPQDLDLSGIVTMHGASRDRLMLLLQK